LKKDESTLASEKEAGVRNPAQAGRVERLIVPSQARDAKPRSASRSLNAAGAGVRPTRPHLARADCNKRSGLPKPNSEGLSPRRQSLFDARGQFGMLLPRNLTNTLSFMYLRRSYDNRYLAGAGDPARLTRAR